MTTKPKKTLKQSLDEVIKTIGNDIKAIFTRLDTIEKNTKRNAPYFNPKHYKQVPSKRMIEVADGLFVNAFEMRKVNFVVKRPKIQLYILNSFYSAYSLHECWQAQDGYELDENWTVENAGNNDVQVSYGQINARIGGQTTVIVKHPDLSNDIEIELIPHEHQRYGTGLQEYLDSLRDDSDNYRIVGDISSIVGDNRLLDKVEVTFADSGTAERFYDRTIFNENAYKYGNYNEINGDTVTFYLDTVVSDVFMADMSLDSIKSVRFYLDGYVVEKVF